MGFTTVFSDSFTNADGTSLPDHDATWINAVNTAEIQNNRAADGSAGLTCRSHLDLAINNDQAVQATVAIANANGWLVSRYTSGGAGINDYAGYECFLSVGFFVVLQRRDDANNTTDIDTLFAVPAYSAGDTLRLEVEGTAVSVKQNDVEILSGMDSGIASGGAAILAQDTAGTWDSLQVDHVVAPKASRRVNLYSLENARVDLVSVENTHAELHSLENARVDLRSIEE